MTGGWSAPGVPGLVVALGLLSGQASAQTIDLPAGTAVEVEITTPIDVAQGAKRSRFAAVLTADLVIDFMLVAADGDVCTGEVTKGVPDTLTLTLTGIRTPRGQRRIVAGDPRFGADSAPASQVVGFGGALAAGDAGGPSRAGQAVGSEGGRLTLPAQTAVVFTLTEPWSLPLREAVSVFPQPEVVEPQVVPSAWFSQVAPKQLETRQPNPQPYAYRRGYGSRGYGSRGHGSRGYGWRGSRYGGRRYGTPWPAPVPDPLKPMTPAQRAAAGIKPVTFPAGTVVTARTSEPIDSSLVEPGAPFAATLMTDLIADGRLIIERGSRADGVVTVGEVGGELLPTLALTQLQLGGGVVGIQTGPVQILHVPAPRFDPAGVGVGGVAAAVSPVAVDDQALRLLEGTILAFSLARPLTVR